MLLGSRPVVDLFNDDDDDAGDGDIFKQISSRAAPENPVSVSAAAKHKVMQLNVCVNLVNLAAKHKVNK